MALITSIGASAKYRGNSYCVNGSWMDGGDTITLGEQALRVTGAYTQPGIKSASARRLRGFSEENTRKNDPLAPLRRRVVLSVLEITFSLE